MHFYCQFYFAGQIIYEIGGLCRIAPPNFADLLTIVQSDVRGGSGTPWGRLKTQAWSARTPQCAFKSASPVEKLAHEAQLPTNGLGASHPVDPRPPETTTAVQSDVRGGSSTPWGRLRTQAWCARTPQCAFKSASPVEKLAHGAQLTPKPGLAPRTQWTQVHQKRLR